MNTYYNTFKYLKEGWYWVYYKGFATIVKFEYCSTGDKHLSWYDDQDEEWKEVECLDCVVGPIPEPNFQLLIGRDAHQTSINNNKF